jgi:isoamylase
VLYEAHVKGMSRQHPGVPEVLRGTYAGLATPAMIEHFQRLGVTAINLLPVHHFLDEQTSGSTKGLSITGATTRSPSLLPNRATQRGSAASR